MPKNIDENIVKMTFDNKDFDKHAQATISVIDKLKSSLDFSKTSESFKALEKSAENLRLDGVSNAINNATGLFNDFFDKIENGIINKLGWNISDFLQKTIYNSTIGSFKNSWSVYEQMIASEQTIMSAVSDKIDPLTKMQYTIDGVNNRLNKLSWYTDETSYNMNQMTNAIANFTSSGIELDSATQMIMGISNACADAGVNAQKADSAYTAFSKAIGSGAMTLGVWNNQLKSSGLVNSERFKQSLIDAGVSAGVLKKKMDGLYVTTNKTLKSGEKVSIADITSALSKTKWMNKKVLENVLNMYASTSDALNQLVTTGKITSTTEDIQLLTEALKKQGKTLASVGLEKKYDTTSDAITALKNAYKTAGLEIPKSLAAMSRAQEATTITQALDSAKIAASSKWRQIYELLFGNYEEAKILWTSLANEAYTWFVEPFNGAIEVLEEWHNAEARVSDNGEIITGYQLFEQTLEKIFNNVTNITETFRAAFSEVFGDITTDGMLNLTKGFNNFIDQISLTDEQLDQLQNILEGIFSIIHLFTSALGVLWNEGIKPIASALKPLADAILELFGNLGLIVKGLDDSVESTGVFSKIVRGAANIISILIGYITDLVKWLNTLFKTGEEGEKGGFAKFFEKLGDIIATVLDKISKLVEGIRPAIEWIKNAVTGLWNVLKTIFANISSGISNTLSNNGTDIAGLATGSGLLVFLLEAAKKLKNFDLGKTIDKALGSISKIRDALKGLFDELKNFLKIKGQVAILGSIGKALLELAAALFIVSMIPTDKLVTSFGALIIGFGYIAMILEYIGYLKSNTKQILVFSKAMKSIGLALIELSIALKIMGSLDINQMGVALLGLLGTLSLVFIFMIGLNKVFSAKGSKANNITKLSKAMKSIGFALIEMSAALWILSRLNLEEMRNGLIAMRGIMSIIGLFTIAIEKIGGGGKSMIGVAAGMLILAPALVIMAGALAILSAVDQTKLSSALGTMLSLITVIGIVSVVMGTIPASIGALAVLGVTLVATSASMILAASGMLIFEKAIEGFEKLNWGVIISNSLKFIAVGVSVMTTSFLLGSAAVPLMLFGAACVALGTGLKFIGEGLTSMLGALTVFALLGEDAGDLILNMLLNIGEVIVAAIPVLILGFIKGITSIAGKILEFIVTTVGTLIKGICTAIINNVPIILETVVTVVTAILSALTELLPKFVEFLEVAVGTLVDTAFRATIVAIYSVAANVGELINSVLNLIVNVINGLADGIRNNAGEFGSAIGNLATSLVESLFLAIGGVVSSIGGWFAKLLGFGAEEDLEVATENASNLGSTTVSEYGNAMEEAAEAKGGAYDKAETIESEVTDKMDGKEDATVSGKNTLGGLIQGLGDSELLAQIKQKGIDAGLTFMEGYKSQLSIHSPSKVMQQEGLFTIQGLIVGLKEQFKNLTVAGSEVSNTVLSAMAESISKADSMIEDDDLQPVITPVIDLSEVDKGLNGLNNSIIQNGVNASGINLTGLTRGLNQQKISDPVFNISFNIDNVGKEITNNDITSWSKQIVQIVNTELGKKMS